MLGFNELVEGIFGGFLRSAVRLVCLLLDTGGELDRRVGAGWRGGGLDLVLFDCRLDARCKVVGRCVAGAANLDTDGAHR